MNEILDRYFQGETTLAEEKSLKAYFASGDIADNHKEYADLFECFAIEQSITYQGEDSIDLLLEKYFEGETSIKEEQRLKAYFNQGEVREEHQAFASLFNYYSEAQTEVLEKAIDLKQAKTLHIVRRTMIGIAAGLALILGSVFVMDSYNDMKREAAMAEAIEEQEAEEALETTMEALAFLGIQFNKGTESLEQIKNLHRADILKN